MGINSATTPALIIAQAQTGLAGIYTVRVSNPFASITSEPASLTVSVARITSIRIVSNGVVLSVQSQPNLNFAVEASSNLFTNSTNWEPLATLLTVPANWNFTDSTGLNSSARFYRIHSVP